jgi:mRNA-degrading endonuclease RelE of RelBE toxin-antitoxin system
LAFAPKLSSKALKYISGLDKPTQKRIVSKIQELANDPFNIRTSKPLIGSQKRTSRVGGYRILFVIDKEVLLVSDVGPRGQIYRKA